MNPRSQKLTRHCLLILLLFSALSVSAQLVPVLEYVSTMSGGNIGAEDMAMDAAGNTYAVGSIFGTADFDPGPGTYNLTAAGSYDVFVSKMDASGNLVWARILGGSKYDQGFGIAVDPSGNVYTTGRFIGTADFDPGAATYNLTAPGVGYSNIFISKLNSNGDFVSALSIGNTTEDVGESISVDASGNVHVLGTFSNTVDFDPGTGSFNLSGNNSQIFILKINTGGGFIWARAITGLYQSYPQAITLDPAGNVYTTGSWYASTMDFDPGPGVYTLTPAASSTDMFISKLDINGNFVWAKRIGGIYTDEGEDIELDNSGNVLITGKYAATVDFDPGAGVSDMTAAEPTGDIFLLKLANDGTYVWSKTMGGVGMTPFSSNENRGQAITSDAAGNIFITGKFSSLGDFDPGPGVVTLNANSTGYTDLFISKFDASGNLMWATDLGAGGYDFGASIRTNASGSIFIAGLTQGTVDFDPSACIFNAGVLSNAFLLKLSEAPPIPAPTITSFTPTFGPVGTPVTITGTNFSTVIAENAATFFNDKTAVVTGSSLTTINTSVPAASTTGVIKVTVACVTATSTGEFTVGATPVITINTQPVAATVCAGTAATFNTVASGTTNLVYQWQFSTTSTGTYNNITNSGGYSNTTTPTLSVNTTGSFGAGYYRCKVDGDFAVTKFTSNVLLTINDPATPTVTDGSRCGAGTVTLTAAGGSAGQYRWYSVATGGTAITGATNATYAPSITATTPYYVSIRIGTCESPRSTITGIVNAIPGKPTISSSITPSGNSVTFCSSNTLTLTAPSGFDTFLWSNGATTQQIIVTLAGNYSVKVINAGCTSVSSDALSVLVQPAPCGNQAPAIGVTSASTTVEGSVTISLASLLSDVDNNIDLSSLKIKSQPISGAKSLLVNTMLTIDYTGIPFSGIDMMAIEVCDLLGSCTQREIEIEVVGDMVVYNGISPNDDGQNDFFLIQYIDVLESTKNNKVSIYNRWGDEVFSVNNYNNDDRVFKGLGKTGNELSSGTYFYKIEFASGKATKTGYLSLKK